MGNRVYESSELAGCEIGTTEFCSDVCADLETRRASDAQLACTTTLRTGYRENSHGGSVAQIGDACYPNLTNGVLTR